MGRFEDLTGKRFGKITVQGIAPKEMWKDKRRGVFWLCQCDCGKITVVVSQSLKNGSTKSCGCGIAESARKRTMINLVGRKFGKLTVKRLATKDEKLQIKGGDVGSWWVCDCDCGTKSVIKKGSNLLSGRVKSCGCYNKEMSFEKNHIDLTGQRFGRLTVIKTALRPEFHHRRGVFWECLCDCGNTTIVAANSLKSGGTVSCGCIISKNESRIQKFLEENKIIFKTQYTFDDLVSQETGWKLKFDFAIFDAVNQLSFLLEYDGEQHYYGTRFSSRKEENEEKYRKMKIYDEAKNGYCKENGIELVRIPYWNSCRIEEILTNKLIEKGMITNGI